MEIGHRYTCFPILNHSPHHLPLHSIPLGFPRAVSLGTLFHESNLHWSSLTYGNVHVSMLFSQSILPCILPLSPTSVFYICASFAALQVGFLLLPFWIPYICVNIHYLVFCFWLTLHCIIGSRFIHFIKTDSNVLLFIADNIPLCICTATSLSFHLPMDI